MNEFKFACPACNQHFKVGAEFVSRRIDCPSCKITIIVPAPLEGDAVPVATLAQPAAQPKTAAVQPPPPPAKPEPPKPAPEPVTAKPEPVREPKSGANKPAATVPNAEPAKPEEASAPPPVTTVTPTSKMRVAVLTPKHKLEIVRAIRPRLADKSRWLPGKKEAGQYNYAARLEGDNLVTVAPTDASATHFSLFGAVLLEFHQRNVMRVTTGRRKFLDVELTAAIQQAMGRQPGGVPISEAEREALTHEQTLAVLDILEKRYKQEAETAKKEEVEIKIDHVLLADLVKKLEKSIPLRAEEVACALYYELEEIKQRLDELEQHANSDE